MEDVKDYLELTNTVLLTKDAFKYLKDCADIVTKIKNGVPREDLGFPVSAEFYNSVEAVNQETVTEFADRCRECGKMRKGHWIFDDECKEHGHCSRCGYGSVDLVDGESHNFCRNCGAWMVESEESEE